MKLKLLIGCLLLNFVLVAHGQDKAADEVARVKFATDLAATTSKQVGHVVQIVTGGEQADGIVIQDMAISTVTLGQGIFSKNIGGELARLGFQKVFVTNGKQWWCDVPDADSDTGWWKPMGLGGPFKSGKEAAEMVATLWPIYIAGKKAPASNTSQNTTPNRERASLHVISRTPVVGIQPFCRTVGSDKICVMPEYQVEAKAGKVHYTLLCSQPFVNGAPVDYSPACIAVKPGSNYPVEIWNNIITFKDSSPYQIVNAFEQE